MYQYKVVELPKSSEGREQLINDLAAHGWELVQVDNWMGYFRREVHPFAPEMEYKTVSELTGTAIDQTWEGLP